MGRRIAIAFTVHYMCCVYTQRRRRFSAHRLCERASVQPSGLIDHAGGDYILVPELWALSFFPAFLFLASLFFSLVSNKLFGLSNTTRSLVGLTLLPYTQTAAG